MAKKKYLGHDELGISFAEWGGLWGFKAIAEAGVVLKPVPSKYAGPERRLLDKYPGAHFFDMGHSCTVQECGSVACIGGTVGLFCNMPDPAKYVMAIDHAGGVLKPLYFPQWNNGETVYLAAGAPGAPAGSYGWRSITPKMAAAAVDNFLRTGKPNWDKVIPKRMRAK
jgi:hypothetical protein